MSAQNLTKIMDRQNLKYLQNNNGANKEFDGLEAGIFVCLL